MLFVSETATELSSGGAPWKLTRNNREYQLQVTKLMLAKEQAFEAIAKTFEAEKVLIVCDRGTLDNRAYMTDEEFRYVLEQLGTNEVELRDHYDAVFHLVTAAKGAESIVSSLFTGKNIFSVKFFGKFTLIVPRFDFVGQNTDNACSNGGHD